MPIPTKQSQTLLDSPDPSGNAQTLEPSKITQAQSWALHWQHQAASANTSGPAEVARSFVIIEMINAIPVQNMTCIPQSPKLAEN